MNTRHIVTVCLVVLLLPSCAFLPALTQEQYGRQRYEEMDQQYAPYRQRNTIEGYREFISKYPKNMYLETALDQIDNLEFAPYEKADTIAAYTEFVARYPGNRHAVTARGRIDQATIKDCERIDTIEAYRQFLQQHPDNIFAQTAQDRLQELEFRELAQKMQQQFGFDLMLYRLHVRRLQKELPAYVRHQPGRLHPVCFTGTRSGQGSILNHTLSTALILVLCPGFGSGAGTDF